jgi:predicted KAP-like P-loop ATPase
MLLDDNPSQTDHFNYHQYVEALTDVIFSIKTTPFTIGIFGAWGSGKTTLMRLIEKALGDRCKKIWFNPWKYDNKEAIWNALIQSILNEMKKEVESQTSSQAKHLLERIVVCGKKLAWYSFKIGANKLTGGVCSDDFLESLKGAFRSNDEAYDFINKFEDAFSDLVNEYCGDKKMVIFIDDLDRCIPENAVTVLESLKLYLDKSKCVFVLGLEKEIVEKGIHFRYKKEIDFSGKDYLEKIIQFPFVIPVVRKEDIEQYLLGGNCPSILPSSHQEDFLKLILNGTEYNIRKIKRFINSFSILKKLHGFKNEDYVRHEVLAEILLLQIRFPAFYKSLARENSLLSEITEKIRNDESPDMSPFYENEDEQNALFDFLQKTKDLPHTPKFVADCITLTSLTT